MSRWVDGMWLLNFFVDMPDDYTLTIGNLRAIVNDAPTIDIMMNDLIKREDVINAIHTYWRKRLETLPTAIVDGEEVYADTRQMDEILKHNKALCNFVKAIPTVKERSRQ